MSKWQLLGNKKKLWSDIWKIKYLCNIATSSPSSNSVHTAPYSLYFSNINIYKPEGDSWHNNIDKTKGDTDSLYTSLGNISFKVTVDISVYMNLTTTVTK